MDPPVRLRPCLGPSEYPVLVDVWRSAVDATHHFLSAHDRDEIEGQMASAHLPEVELTVADVDGSAVGFAGTLVTRLEMLFVRAEARGTGVGSALLTHAVSTAGVRSVDVNEQNDLAVRFYRRRGFEVIGRRALDEAGRPYPLLHLALVDQASNTWPHTARRDVEPGASGHGERCEARRHIARHRLQHHDGHPARSRADRRLGWMSVEAR